MAEKDKTTTLVVLAVVLGVAYFLLMGNPFEKQTTPTPVIPGGVICESSTTPDLDINAYDIDNPGTALTEATNLYRKVGETAWNSFTQGTAITNLELNEVYEVVLGISASDFVDNAYGEYFKTDAIGCREVISMDKGVHNDASEDTLTATFYNRNHDASNENFTAGQVKNVYLHFEAGSDTIFGNKFIASSGLSDNGKHRAKYPNVLCMNLNKTSMDTPDAVSFEGEELNKISTPQRLTTGQYDTSFCYEAPVITDIGQEIKVRLDADDSNDVNSDSTAYLYAGNFYIDDAGELAWGIETDEGAVVGTDTYDSLTMDFTS